MVTEPHLGKPNRNKRKILKRNKPHLPFRPTFKLPTKNCNKKKRFKTSTDAQVMCDELNQRYAMQEIPAEVYYCYKHSAWHVGHNRRGAVLAALRRRKNESQSKP